jgi:hypothetical protein
MDAAAAAPFEEEFELDLVCTPLPDMAEVQLSQGTELCTESASVNTVVQKAQLHNRRALMRSTL